MRLIPVCLFLIGVNSFSGVAAERLLPSEIGARIYNEGILSSGKPIKAVTQGDIKFSGAQFSCINCHRRSGYGSSEGGTYVLPITGSALFAPRELDRADLFKKLFTESQSKKFWARVRSPQMRPAYTRESLARAIRNGIDPTGRELDPLMPRYDIPNEDMDYLNVYLRRLSIESDPGVDKENIYFATIVTDIVDAGRKEAMLSTMRAFTDWMNIDTKGDLRNPNFSPKYRSEFIKAYRYWNLDIWELTGSPDTWHKQLLAYYARRPVFAVISGMTNQTWRPVDQFCDSQRIPCLFPHTDLPDTSDDAIYSLHFTRGLSLEAEVVAMYLSRESKGGQPQKIMQLHNASPGGLLPANIIVESLKQSNQFEIESHTFSTAGELIDQLESLRRNLSQLDILMIWPDQLSSEAVNWLIKQPSIAKRIFLPSKALAQMPDNLIASEYENLRFIYPYEIPTAYHPRSFRVRGWMHARNIDISHPRLQFNTYYAMTMVQFGLQHIIDNFSRDYLLEYIEHEAENALNPGTYPRLSLGPGQRFASKGAYLVRYDSVAKKNIKVTSGWIVP